MRQSVYLKEYQLLGRICLLRCSSRTEECISSKYSERAHTGSYVSWCNLPLESRGCVSVGRREAADGKRTSLPVVSQ